MKEKIISPLLAILSIMALMPGIAYAQSNTIAVSPSSNAGKVGDSFTVAVTIEDAASLVGYDVSLTFDTGALDIVSCDLTGLYAAHGISHFYVVQTCSDAAGLVRLADSALSGASINVPAGSPENLFTVTFMVAASMDSPLNLVDVELACLSGGAVVSCPATTIDGAFFVPPNVVFDVSIPPSHYIAPSNTQRFLSKGENFVDLNGFVQLDASAPRSGFGGIRFTVQDPQGNMYSGDSNIAFMFPGGTAAVQGTVTYGNIVGTYKLFVTVLQCTGPDISSCVTGPTSSAKFFKVHF